MICVSEMKCSFVYFNINMVLSFLDAILMRVRIIRVYGCASAKWKELRILIKIPLKYQFYLTRKIIPYTLEVEKRNIPGKYHIFITVAILSLAIETC